MATQGVRAIGFSQLWLRIWLAAIGVMLVFALGAALFFHFVIVPQMEEVRAARHEWLKELPESEQLRLREMLPHRFHPPPPRGFQWQWWALFGLGLGLATYPVVRQLTGRIEQLQRSVEALGAGDFQTRVAVKGHDEVAQLAHSFNAAAERIEHLMMAQKRLLAHTSHELRTPLTRLRLGLEGIKTANPSLWQQMQSDIRELDDLMGEILLASRLEAQASGLRRSEVDLLGLCAEEAAHTGAHLQGDLVTLQGDEFLLRRLVRNLLENANRYAPGVNAEIEIRQTPDGVRLQVLDRGPGVPEDERDQIFQPFFRGRTLNHQLSPSGAGLGLALVKMIAEKHGGTVQCLPRDGGGACFEVLLR